MFIIYQENIKQNSSLIEFKNGKPHVDKDIDTQYIEKK